MISTCEILGLSILCLTDPVLTALLRFRGWSLTLVCGLGDAYTQAGFSRIAVSFILESFTLEIPT
jgi:hypothetical protein